MAEMKYNLLAEPLIGVRLADGTRKDVNLPEVLALLAAGDDIAAFTGLQRHQHHAWYAFLVQLAAIGLHLTGNVELDLGEESWKSVLLAATENRQEPWSLFVSDLGTPAAGWGWQVLTGSSDGLGGVLFSRKVNEFKGQWYFGGGNDYDCDPHVMDILGDHAQLAGYECNDDGTTAKHAVITLIKP